MDLDWTEVWPSQMDDLFAYGLFYSAQGGFQGLGHLVHFWRKGVVDWSLNLEVLDV